MIEIYLQLITLVIILFGMGVMLSIFKKKKIFLQNFTIAIFFGMIYFILITIINIHEQLGKHLPELNLIAFYFSNTCYFYIYLFVDDINGNRPTPFKQTYFIIVFSLNVGFLLLDLCKIITIHLAYFHSFLDALLGVSAFYYATVRAYKAFRLHSTVATLHDYMAYLCFLIGLTFLLFGAVAGNFYITDWDLVYTIARVFYAIGAVIFISNYFTRKYIFEYPFNVYIIMVFTKSGIPLYVRKIKNRKNLSDTVPWDLATSLFSAISNLSKESLGTSQPLDVIDSSLFKILFKHDKSNELMMAFISDNSSNLLQLHIQAMIDQIAELLLPGKENWENKIQLAPIIDKILLDCCPNMQLGDLL